MKKPRDKGRESRAEDRRFGEKGPRFTVHDQGKNARPRPSNERAAKENAQPATPDCRLVYGVLPVLEALRANSRRVDKILIVEGVKEHRLNEIFDLARQSSILIDRVSREYLSRLVGGGANHQGVALMTASAEYVPSDEIFN
ncbi:MAG: RNA methyltransferase substrate-binding domain-containing protein [Pyrinomonadaceae bacterium]